MHGFKTGWLADNSFNFQIWPFVSLQLLNQNLCLEPHLKDTFHICLEIKVQGFWMTFKVFNLCSKYPYFIRAYVVRGWVFFGVSYVNPLKGCQLGQNWMGQLNRVTFRIFLASFDQILSLGFSQDRCKVENNE